MKLAFADYFTLNTKVLPANAASTERYTGLLQNWFNKGYRINTKGDRGHYYVLRDLTTFGEGKFFYGVVSKFVDLDQIDFIDSESGRLLEHPIPDNVEGRISEYEFVFIPECHRFAFIKSGKIDPTIKKRGASLKKMQEIIENAFNNGLEPGEAAIVDYAQEQYVFEEIFSSDLLSLHVKVSYTNDDLRSEGTKLIDSMMQDDHIGQITAHMKPDNTGVIDTDKTFTKAMLELAEENGSVRAKIDTGEEEKVVNSLDYPSVQTVEAQDDNSRIYSFALNLYNKFMDKYRRGNTDNEG